MDFSSFFTSLGTSLVIFFILMFLFSCLSRKHSNNVIYYPNRILKGMDPYEGMHLTRNPFAWIREAVSSTEADILKVSGVDTAVYFVFLTNGNYNRLANLYLLLYFNKIFRFVLKLDKTCFLYYVLVYTLAELLFGLMQCWGYWCCQAFCFCLFFCQLQPLIILFLF